MFALRALFVAGLAVASTIPARIPVQKRGTGVCTSSEFVTPVSVGGAGTAFCESSWGGSYAPVSNITVWSNDNIVTGMQLTYSDGTASAVLGNQAATTKKIGVRYGANDLWSRVSLYGGQGSGSYVLHLLLETSNGDIINNGQVVNSGSSTLPRHDQPVGSGVLYGVQGNYGPAGQIRSLEFLFLNSPITTIAVSNLQFPNGPIGTSQQIYPTSIGQASFEDNTNENVTYQFNNQVSETQAYAYQQTSTNTFTVMNAVNFMLSFSLLGITAGGGETTTYVWTNTETYQTTATFTQAIQVQYNAQITLAPGQSARCTAVCGQGQGTFAYTSTVTITLKNGNSYSFPEDGKLTVTSFSEGIAQCSQD